MTESNKDLVEKSVLLDMQVWMRFGRAGGVFFFFLGAKDLGHFCISQYNLHLDSSLMESALKSRTCN